MIFKLNSDKYHNIDGSVKVNNCYFRSKTKETPNDEILIAFKGGILETEDPYIIETLKKAKFCSVIKETKNENNSTKKV